MLYNSTTHSENTSNFPLDRTWADISIDALCNNYSSLRMCIPSKCRLLCVVKDDAYGHGAAVISKYLENWCADYFGVATIDEGIYLRESGIKAPILILGNTPKHKYELISKYNLTATIYDLESAKILSSVGIKSGQNTKVHIKIDSGMTRLGFQSDKNEMETSVREICEIFNLSNIETEGIFTHFACAESNERYTKMQLNRFLSIINAIESEGHKFKLRHCANSSAILNYPETHLDMVRAGIALYNPCSPINSKQSFNLLPIMSLKSCIISLKEIPVNTPISYGGTILTQRNSRIAVVSIGYGDGYPRSLSNKHFVIIHGKKAKIMGKICMDLTMVDVTDIENVCIGDVATIIGKDGEISSTADDIATITDTISYEIFCNINKRIPRIYSYH